MLNDKNPRRFWNNYKMIDRTKKLATIASRLFSVPCSSASCERSFSTQKRVHTKDRNRLKEEKIHKLGICTSCRHQLLKLMSRECYICHVSWSRGAGLIGDGSIFYILSNILSKPIQNIINYYIQLLFYFIVLWYTFERSCPHIHRDLAPNRFWWNLVWALRATSKA